MPDANKTGGNNVQQETPDKFNYRQRHDFLSVPVCIVFPFKGNAFVVH